MLFAAFVDHPEDIQELSANRGIAGKRNAAQFFRKSVGRSMCRDVGEVSFHLPVH